MNQLPSVFPLDLLIEPLVPSDRKASPMSQGLLLAGRNHSPAQEELPHLLHPVLREAKRKEQTTAAAPAGFLRGVGESPNQQPQLQGPGGPEGWRRHPPPNPVTWALIGSLRSLLVYLHVSEGQGEDT